MAKAPAQTETRVASVKHRLDPSSPGVVLDWTLLGSATNTTTLKGDTTYYVGGNVNLSAPSGAPALIIEGGTVAKFTNSTATARITINGPIRLPVQRLQTGDSQQQRR